MEEKDMSHIRFGLIEICAGTREVQFRGMKKIVMIHKPTPTAEGNCARITFRRICRPLPDVCDIEDLGDRVTIYFNNAEIISGKKIKVVNRSVPSWTIAITLEDVTFPSETIESRFEILDL
jgi:hypothetical protein